jgi:hypothetical protein
LAGNLTTPESLGHGVVSWQMCHDARCGWGDCKENSDVCSRLPDIFKNLHSPLNRLLLDNAFRSADLGGTNVTDSSIGEEFVQAVYVAINRSLHMPAGTTKAFILMFQKNSLIAVV